MIPTQSVSNDGIQLAVETFGAGEPLLFAHGLQGTRKLTKRQLEPLADKYRITLFDQRGHGDSTPITAPALYDANRMAADLRAVLDSLGVERAIVGGESTGAATATLFALKHPDRVKGLLLTAPAFGDTPNPDRQRLKDLGAAMKKMGMPEYLKASAVRQRELFNWSPEVIQVVGEMIGAHQADSLGTALQTIPDWQIFSDLSVLATIRCPTCLIAWDGDPLHPLALAQRYVQVLPNARLVMMPTLPEIFANPRRIGEIYREFLQERV